MRDIRKFLLILTLLVILPAAAVAAVPECFPPDVMPSFVCRLKLNGNMPPGGDI